MESRQARIGMNALIFVSNMATSQKSSDPRPTFHDRRSTNIALQWDGEDHMFSVENNPVQIGSGLLILRPER